MIEAYKGVEYQDILNVLLPGGLTQALGGFSAIL